MINIIDELQIGSVLINIIIIIIFGHIQAVLMHLCRVAVFLIQTNVSLFPHL